MQNLYNAKVSFKGEGSFTFVMPQYGEVTIYAGKDIFMKNMTQAGVETLRTLRPVLLDHKLNAKPEGCFTLIDFAQVNNVVPTNLKMNYRNVESTKTLAQMKAEMIKGPINEDELVSGLATSEKVLEPKTETEPEIDAANYILTSTKHSGKKISELSRAQINGNIKRFNEADLEMIKAYLNN